MIEGDRSYRPDIDGLRAVAVVAVIVFHAFPSRLPGGFVGVDVFFVISGYLISGIILKATSAGRFSYAHFYARRIRRIFPALAVVLGAVMIAGWFRLYADDYARLGRHAAAGAAFASNFAFWQEASYFDVAADLKPLLHLWSLGVEEQFYLVWPILLVLAARWRRGPLVATLVIGTISFLFAIWTVRIDRTAAFYAPWNRFWELLAGATLACVEADAALDQLKQRFLSKWWLPDVAATIGMAGIAAGVWFIDSTRVFPGLWVMLPVGGAFLLMVADRRAWVNRTILSQPIIVSIGLISYPLYLWHWPLLSLARIVQGGVPSLTLRLALLGVSVGLAAATYLAIERPIRFGSAMRIAVPGLAVAMSIVCAAGAVVFSSGGFIDRPINRNDGARLIAFYDRMRTGLDEAYRRECDFMDWHTERTRDSIDASCTQPGIARTALLWGDSFAQSLSLGLRESLPPDTALAQVTTSACRAQVDEFDLSVKDRRCEKANQYAIDAITRLRPHIVVIAQSDRHTQTDWRRLTARVLGLGAGHVIVVGPFPVWRPSLPRIYAANHMSDRPEYVGIGLDTQIFESDRTLTAHLNGVGNVTYVSLLEQLCMEHACRARVPDQGELDLMTLDFGHLTPKGSSYLGRVMWKRYLAR
ncbi:MAG TPA: acyltransferase family protein [Vicinamibacterales bacterium]|nr:acyltransferase family protein [Vicinamibacterales bacterium]